MVRLSKQERIRNVSPRRPRRSSTKTGPKKDNLPQGFKVHANAIDTELAQRAFIPKIK